MDSGVWFSARALDDAGRRRPLFMLHAAYSGQQQQLTRSLASVLQETAQREPQSQLTPP